jgi:hypothetical protein
MLILIALVVLVIVLICVAVNKDSKSDNTIQQLKDRKAQQPLSTYDRLVEKEKELTDTKTSFLFKDMEFDLCLFKHSRRFLIQSYCVFVRSPQNLVGAYSYHLDDFYADGNHDHERFVEDFIKEAVPVENSRKTLKGLLGENDHTMCEQWLQIGSGEYFTNTNWKIFRFSDWESITNPREILKLIQGVEIKRCEDPHKTHWQHFLELKMKAKKQREEDCVKFVDKILDKQKEYNDLQYKYEMLPSAPISDYESFTNFCKIVKEDVCYEDHEIQNYIFMKKLK